MSNPNYAEESAKLKGSAKKKKSIPKVKKCSYTGCPLNAATVINGRYACNFHFDGDFHQEVTLAIRNNKMFLQNYNRMVKWQVNDWQKNKNRLLNHAMVPMEENETPSGYLVKFFNFIEQKINNESSDMATRRLQNSPVSFEDEE